EMYLSGELARTIQGFAEDGFHRTVRGHGPAAAYGAFLAMLSLDGPGMRRHFVEVLDRIRSGEFARRLQQEAAAGYATYSAIDKIISSDAPLTEAERRVRAGLADPPAPADRAW